MILLFALQLALPFVLLGCVAMTPARSRLGFWIQALATAAVLVAVSLVGPLTILPWWSPYAFGALLLFALLLASRRRPSSAALRPSGIGGWTAGTAYLALGALALYLTAAALAGRTPPPGQVVNLAFPLEEGTYLVVNGGNHISINSHLKTLDAATPRFLAWRGQSYGVDIVEVDTLGFRASGIRPADPRAYRIYGAKVRAPCSGEIVATLDKLPDMQVPQTDRTHLAGNHVILRCGRADIVLGHFRPGSLEVTAGARVERGAPIAEVGNSGKSDEPHLHIHAQEPGPANQPMAGTPLSMRFDGRYVVRNDRVTVP